MESVDKLTILHLLHKSYGKSIGPLQQKQCTCSFHSSVRIFCKYIYGQQFYLLSLMIASSSLGAAHASLTMARDHLKTRSQFGQTLDKFQVSKLFLNSVAWTNKLGVQIQPSTGKFVSSAYSRQHSNGNLYSSAMIEGDLLFTCCEIHIVVHVFVCWMLKNFC